MEILAGGLYFVADAFFARVNDPYLKINYDSTKRPHYFAFRDDKTQLYWLVPCSSKVEKFERLIEKKRARNKPTDAIQIVKIFDKKTVLLFQDMFPATLYYIEGPYIKGGQLVRVADPKCIQKLEKTARKIIGMLHRGVRFTPTQPDILRIERLMLEDMCAEDRADL